MSKVSGKTFVSQPESDDRCQLCGKMAELRPYGPGGKRICFQCGQKDPGGTLNRFKKVLDGCDDVTVAPREN